MKVICFNLQQKHYMDKFSYAIGLGIGQNLLSMGAKGIAVDDFAQAIKDVLEGNQTAISHTEAREIVNKYFEELEQKMNCLLYTSPSPRDRSVSRMPSSA